MENIIYVGDESLIVFDNVGTLFLIFLIFFTDTCMYLKNIAPWFVNSQPSCKYLNYLLLAALWLIVIEYQRALAAL
jgi:hypothetical protein